MGAMHPSVRRLFLAGAFAVAAAAPVITAVATAPAEPPARLADCPAGEEGDIYTLSCVPMLVPNSPAITPAAPVDVTVPSTMPCPSGVSGAECAGAGQGQVLAPQVPAPGQIQPGQPEEQLQDVSTPGY